MNTIGDKTRQFCLVSTQFHYADNWRRRLELVIADQGGRTEHRLLKTSDNFISHNFEALNRSQNIAVKSKVAVFKLYISYHKTNFYIGPSLMSLLSRSMLE